MNEKKKTESTDELVSELFALLYRREWVSLHDARSKAVYTDFKNAALQLVKMLLRNNSDGVYEADRQLIATTAGRVADCVTILVNEKIVFASQVADLLRLLQCLSAGMEYRPHCVIEK